MKPIQRALSVLTAAALPITGLVVFAGPASAATETISCGEQVTHSLTAANDIGPCPADGLDIVASGVTVDLGGHTVTGGNATNTTTNDYVGIHLMGVSGVTVRNGTVQDFDAGVSIEGGSGNTVTSITARDNISHYVLTTATGSYGQCDYGDGILTDGSSNNRIQGNLVMHNGPYDGIGLINNSDGNTVDGNSVTNNDVANLNPAGSTTVCGTGQGAMQLGRGHQDIGIRLEGPGDNNNTITGNQVAHNEFRGIAALPTLCGGMMGMPPAPNTNNTISRNNVTDNGFGEGNGSGIDIIENGPAGVSCPSAPNTIVDNVSTANYGSGITIGGRGTGGNTVNGNVVQNNRVDGIHVNGPEGSNNSVAGSLNNTLVGNRGSGNAHDDGFDGNAQCDNNHWMANQFRTVNQACVAAGGGTGMVTG
ncbi:MAG: right-handed parallel beta-helix repeat-containing protein [Acidimicrobiales bacterium]